MRKNKILLKIKNVKLAIDESFSYAHTELMNLGYSIYTPDKVILARDINAELNGLDVKLFFAKNYTNFMLLNRKYILVGVKTIFPPGTLAKVIGEYLNDKQELLLPVLNNVNFRKSGTSMLLFM